MTVADISPDRASESAADPFVRCDHLVKFFDTASGRVQAVRGVDLELFRGTVSAIVGPSGSGKSSLLRMLSGLERPTAGLVLLDGIDLWKLGERERARRRATLLTHVEQRPDDNLFAHLPATLQLQRMAPADTDGPALAAQWLELLGLADRSDSLPSQMSGGERQRLAFARAAVAGHGLVIADEPTSQLDGTSAAAVLDAVDLLAARGATVLLATHDRRVLERVRDVIELRDGAVATVTSGGSPLSVIDRSGRLQLPPELLERFPDRRVLLRSDGEHVRLEAP